MNIINDSPPNKRAKRRSTFSFLFINYYYTLIGYEDMNDILLREQKNYQNYYTLHHEHKDNRKRNKLRDSSSPEPLTTRTVESVRASSVRRKKQSIHYRNLLG